MKRRHFFGSVAASALVTPAGAQVAAATAIRGAPEDIIDANRAIVDPHHHLWDHAGDRYLLPELLGDLGDGHRIVKTVYIEAGSMYRADGPPEFKSVGETEFANGVAAMSASGAYGPCRVAAGIIGSVDLRFKARAGDVLRAHIAAGNGRLRGIRTSFPGDPHYAMRSMNPPNVLADVDYRAGFDQLARLELVCDVWCLFSQLPGVASLADAFPRTPIVIDHLGTPVLTGYYRTRRPEVFAALKQGLVECARRPNVVLKVGGLGMKLADAYLFDDTPATNSEALAASWKPYIDASIDIFGPDRCMFESNFPADRATCSYRTLWNALKRVAANYSETEKTALFSGTATRVYRL